MSKRSRKNNAKSVRNLDQLKNYVPVKPTNVNDVNDHTIQKGGSTKSVSQVLNIAGSKIEVHTYFTEDVYPIQSIFRDKNSGRHYLLHRPLVSRGLVPTGKSGPNGQPLLEERDISMYSLISIDNSCKARQSFAQDIGKVSVATTLNGVTIAELEKQYKGMLSLEYVGKFSEMYQQKDNAKAKNFADLLFELRYDNVAV